MKNMDQDLASIEQLVPYVQEAGMTAYGEQKKGSIERRYKLDGSVVTKIDHQIDLFLIEKISNLYPEASFLTEETVPSPQTDTPYIFVIDPIDGTDAFSCGMHGWCVSVGVLKDSFPVAGVIYSPALDLLLFADTGKRATLNGKIIEPANDSTDLSTKTNIMVTSSIHQLVDLRRYPGKIRSIGSAALHLCFPLIYPGIYAAVEGSRAHIWDILAAHAINLSHGFGLEQLHHGQIDYKTWRDGSPLGDGIVAGPIGNILRLKNLLNM